MLLNTRLGLVSAYSFLYGVHMPSVILDRALSLGVKTVSICDINNLYGLHSVLEASKERGIRPVIGAALSARGGKLKTAAGSSVYCFVENRAGFSRLCEILSIRGKGRDNFDLLPLLREDSGGLVLASADEASLSGLAGGVKRLYAALTPSNLKALNAAKRLNIAPAFLDDSVFLDGSDFAVHRVLRAIGLLKTTGSLAPEDTAQKERVLLSGAEIRRRLAAWPQAFRGTEEIAALCAFNDVFKGWIFPSYQSTLNEESVLPEEELRKRVYCGAEKRYGELGDAETGRIDYELGIINEKGFASYFLIIDDIVKMAASSKSSTCGRGSGAASIVSYALGITNVDPLRHKLYFERFLNPSRSDPPDIDIDFAWDERDELIKAVIERFGSGRCARVANHNIFRCRSALRETAKAYGFGDAEITQVERRVFQQGDKPLNLEPLWREIFSTAEKIEGLPRGLGMHCGGLVITPQHLSKYAPVEKSAEGYPLLAWEKEGTEAAGFVKIDLLGNRSLAVIRDTLKNLENQGLTIDPNLWRPVDDRATVEALSKGDSIGVFYIESPAMRQLQKKTKAGDFDHIVIHSSIIRPAANKFISEYVRRLKGGKWEPLHPRLEKILDESYGILCYQEDVSKTAVALAGFNEADADKLRKVIAKKAGRAKLAVYEKQFFEGCRGNGVSDNTAQKIWEMMLSFDGYSFCKPHSASYAIVSFQSAYLHVHHPAEFMAAVLSNQGGYYRPHAYIAEARRMRLFIKGPDVNISLWNYYGTGTGQRGTVVIGLMAVKGLSVSGAKLLLEEREKRGSFTSLDNFAARVRLNRDDVASLCPAGAFDSISGGLPRPIQARLLLAARNNESDELFGSEPEASDFAVFSNTPRLIPLAKHPVSHNVCAKVKNYSELWEEYKALGFLRNYHPLVLWKDRVMSVKYRVKAVHLDKYTGRNVKMAGWPVTQKDVWTKDGLTMSFLSLEDETAMYETVIFPKEYERYSKLLFDQRPLLIYGYVSDDQGALSVEINRIKLLEEVEEN